MSASDQRPERRRHHRSAASGEVELTLEDSHLTFTAELRDTSEGGFRAAHGRLDLQSGQRVRFRYGSRSGRAVVVWNRIEGSMVTSGFRVETA